MAPPEKALLSLHEVVRSFGAQPVLKGVSLTVHQGDRLGLIGRNGSGKSTMLRILSGMDEPDSGIVARGQGLSVEYLPQVSTLNPAQTVLSVLEAALEELRHLLRRYHDLAGAMSSPGAHEASHEEFDALHHRLSVLGAWDAGHEHKWISEELCLPADDRRLESLSGGELRRVALAGCILRRPDILLLDEPTNHIDTDSVEWIEAFLERYPGSCILVTHDRYFLDRVVNRIVELEFGKLISFPGNYERFLEYKAGLEDTRQRTEDNRQSLLRRELEWVRRGPKARTTKQLARIKRFDALQESAPKDRHREFAFEIPESEPLGKVILEAKDLSYKIEGRVLFKDFALLMQKHMRVGILGPNGCGKTSLLQVLMGSREAWRGRVTRGENTQFLYVSQSGELSNPEQTVLGFVSDGARYLDVSGRKLHVPAYIERFLFDASVIQAPIHTLSGGERARLALLKNLLRGGNFLVLDEPTNDLDLYSLRVLEEAIDAFGGCALIVSHDRYFLNRVCTHMLIFEEGGKIETITGGYDDFLLYRSRKKAGPASLSPVESPRVEEPPPVKSRSPRKLSYIEKQELEGIEASILDQEEEVLRLERRIHEPDFYREDNAVVQATLRALEDAKACVRAAYDRWEALDAMRQR